MTEWQPIETAPKDGTAVMLFIPTWNQKVLIGRFVDSVELEYGAVKRERKYWFAGATYGMHDNPEPTHWMPIPSGPEVVHE